VNLRRTEPIGQSKVVGGLHGRDGGRRQAPYRRRGFGIPWHRKLRP
jgi:hypothetical protein